MARVLTPRAEDFPRWYQDLIAKAQLADNGPVRGTMVIRPVGYAIWERMQADMDARIKAAGVQNAYFPLFIPENYLRREADHVEGFSPELAVVTHAGGKELAEPLVVRPTSETVIGEFMAKWVDSYRDLPLLLNQWANVVRWELRPRTFLRTTEFLWQEGHTAHATEQDAREHARDIHRNVYQAFMEDFLAIPVIPGRKTKGERFAGATNTMTVEAMMGDGKALQMGTSHELGQNFAKAFDITYSSAGRTVEHAWTTSWGTSTRMVGGLIMVHGDDNGLRLPPRLAPIQVQIMVVKAGEGVTEAAVELSEELKTAGVRVKLDDRADIPFGRRAVDAELQGIPIRVEVGPRDLATGNVTVARRIDGSKSPIPLADVVGAVTSALKADQQRLFDDALAFRQERTVDVKTLGEAIEVSQTGFARVPWSAVGEAGEKEANGKAVTVRCLTREDGSMPESDDEPNLIAYLGRSY
ncbi:proline--tRNA ligase [Actinoplanes sp. NPDC023714]|uniref:proline--tRNA ligase n=1 Tax=Actinoplanes sp. NPDC023714 TaxID=3154322 RepID=UPI003406CAC2